jgi:lipopolysaccharide export system permease protein
MRILHRHLLASLLVPTLACLAGVTLLWVVYDLVDNYNDFLEAGVSAGQVWAFYAASLPEALDAVLPVALLAGLLYTLAQFSRTHQFTAMQSCGIGILRIAAPFLLVGMVFALVQAWLHWELVPGTAREREVRLAAVRAQRPNANRERGDGVTDRRALVFRNIRAHRVWFVGQADLRTATLRDVEVLQTDESGRDVAKWYAGEMRRDGAGWVAPRAVALRYDASGDASAREERTDLRLDWPETPEQIAGGMDRASGMSVPELRGFLKRYAGDEATRLAPAQSYLAHRLGAGWFCMGLAMTALAFGIGDSRRSVFPGIGRTLVLFVGAFVASKLFLALGQGGRVPPWVGGMGPGLAFAFLGAVLLLFRATHQEMRAPAQWWYDRRARKASAAPPSGTK